jgi:hypothetical protein
VALQDAVNHKKYLLSFLQDGRIELFNNHAERSIKPFVIGRKNWLFCNTPSGAKSYALPPVSTGILSLDQCFDPSVETINFPPSPSQKILLKSAR